MQRKLLRKIDEHADLFIDPRTGIAWVEDRHAGIGHSCHPNISARGSVAGMRKKGYWGPDDKTIRSHGFIYNVSLVVTSDDYDRIARDACKCGGTH